MAKLSAALRPVTGFRFTITAYELVDVCYQVYLIFEGMCIYMSDGGVGLKVV